MSELAQLMDLFYDFKDKLTDNEYKSGVELLHAMHKKYPCLRQIQRQRQVQRPPPPPARVPYQGLVADIHRLNALVQRVEQLGVPPPPPVPAPPRATRREVELSGPKVLRILRALGVSDPSASRVTITATNDLTTSCDSTIRAMVANMMTCVQLWNALIWLATPAYLRRLPPRNRMSKRDLVNHALVVFTFDITIN